MKRKWISSSERTQEGISHTRWNQHNMSSYEVWGHWPQWRNFDWKLLGIECVRKEDIMRYATLMKAINIQKTKKIWLLNLPERYEDSDGSLKNMETLDYGYLWEMCQHVCSMLKPTKRCHDEEPYRMTQFYIMLCFYFLNNIWMSSCKANHTRFVSTNTTIIHVEDGNSLKKHDKEEVAIWRRFQRYIKKSTFHEERNDMTNQEGKWSMSNALQGRSSTEFHDTKEINRSAERPTKKKLLMKNRFPI